MLATKKLNRDVLLDGIYHARPKLTSDVLPDSLTRITGTSDLYSRLEAFIVVGEASGYTQKTVQTYRYHLGTFIRYIDSLGVKHVQSIAEEHIASFLNHKRKTCGGVAINTYYRNIRAWINWLVKRKAIAVSPLAEFKTPPIPKTVIKPLTPEQVQKMISCCTHYFSGVRNKAILSVLFDSGMRRTEIASVKLDDVDINRGAIKVYGKGSRERYVAIGSATKSAIVDYLLMRDDSLPWLFVSQLKARRDKLSPDAITQIVEKAMKSAGITGVKYGAHTLRHSFATQSIRNGANLFYVQSLLGHSTLNMTRRYAATVDSEEAVKSHHTFSPMDRMKKTTR